MKSTILAIAIAGMTLSLSSGAMAAQQINSCMECHGDKKVAFLDSIHARSEMTCTTCHGGDPARMDRSAHQTGNFRGKPDRTKIPGLCASCHSREDLMRQYGLAVDQLSEYRTSQHGRRLFQQHDLRVAVCTDCHGSHRILRKTDPRSSVFPANIPGTCGRCHADRRLMQGYQLPSRTVADYRTGVHGQALRNHDLRAPTCVSCHSSHGARPPGVTEVANVCGQCHAQERDAFRQSVHKRAMDRSQIKECLSCHDQHATMPATPAMFARVCRTCHDPASRPFQDGQAIQAQLTGAQDAIAEARKGLVEIGPGNLVAQPLLLRLRDAREQLQTAASISHRLSASRVDDYARPARSIAEEVQASLRAIVREERIWLAIKFAGGAALLVILLALASIYYRLRQAYRRPLDQAVGLRGPAYLRVRLWWARLASLVADGHPRTCALLMIGVDNYAGLSEEERARAAAHLGRLLRRGVRAEDAVAQFQADRFAVVLAAVDLEQARAVAARLQAMARSSTLPLSTSVGLALPGLAGGNPGTLIARAGRALDECAGGAIRQLGDPPGGQEG